MTRGDWLSCTNPDVMLYSKEVPVSPRQLRLFAAACCRRLLRLGFPIEREVLILERAADGQASAAELAEVAACGQVKYEEGLDTNGGRGPLLRLHGAGGCRFRPRRQPLRRRGGRLRVCLGGHPVPARAGPHPRAAAPPRCPRRATARTCLRYPGRPGPRPARRRGRAGLASRTAAISAPCCVTFSAIPSVPSASSHPG